MSPVTETRSQSALETPMLMALRKLRKAVICFGLSQKFADFPPFLQNTLTARTGSGKSPTVGTSRLIARHVLSHAQRMGKRCPVQWRPLQNARKRPTMAVETFEQRRRN